MTDITERPSQTLPGSAETSPLAVLIERLLTWQERSRQRRDLRSLDERALRDIGLSAADVEAESCKPFWMA